MSFGPCNDCCDIGSCDPPSHKNFSFQCNGAKSQEIPVNDPPSDLDPLRSPDWVEVRDDTWECNTSYTPHDNCDDATEWGETTSFGHRVPTGFTEITTGGTALKGVAVGCPSTPLAEVTAIPSVPQQRSMLANTLSEAADLHLIDGHAGRSALIYQWVTARPFDEQYSLVTNAKITYGVFILLQPVSTASTMKADCGVHTIRFHYRLSAAASPTYKPATKRGYFSGVKGSLPTPYISELSRDTFAETSNVTCNTDTLANSTIEFRRGSVSDPNPYQDALQDWLDGVTGSEGSVTPATDNSIATFDCTGVTGISVGANDYIFVIIGPVGSCYTSNPLDTWPGQPTRDIAYQLGIGDNIRSLAVQKIQYLDASSVVVWEEEVFETE